MSSHERFAAAQARIDQANAEDPERVEVEGVLEPAALVYGRRMSERLARFAPDADDAQRLAARAQHIRRFMHPRSAHPKGRAGYLAWRTALGRFHADQATAILSDDGYDAVSLERVRRMLEKRARRSDPDVQRIEDVACLVFLEHYALDFAGKHSKEQVVAIVQKTWAKMSPEGHEAALGLALPPAVRALVEEALAG